MTEPATQPTPSQRGMNLIETAIVLAIVGLVIGGIWVAAATVMENNRQSTALQQMLTITENIRKRFPIGTPFCAAGASPSCSGGTVSEYSFSDTDAGNYIMKPGWYGVIPENMITTSTRPISPWGAPILLGIRNFTGEIFFTFYNLSKASCASFAPKVAGALGQQLISIYVFSGSNLSLATPELAAQNCATNLPIYINIRR